jgi:hypothetical protein
MHKHYSGEDRSSMQMSFWENSKVILQLNYKCEIISGLKDMTDS